MRWPWSKKKQKPEPVDLPVLDEQGQPEDADLARVVNAAWRDGEAYFQRDENGAYFQRDENGELVRIFGREEDPPPSAPK